MHQSEPHAMNNPREKFLLASVPDGVIEVTHFPDEDHYMMTPEDFYESLKSLDPNETVGCVIKSEEGKKVYEKILEEYGIH